MRFLQFMIVSFAVFTTALFGSCTSKEGTGEEPESPTTTSYKVRVKVSTGEYTRAGDDAAVNTLHLAFYNGEECLGIVEATKDNDAYVCEIPAEYGKPDGVIAFANLPADDLPTKDNVMTKTYSNFGNGDNMIMSSARYFDAKGNDKLKTPLTTMNFIEGGDAVSIALDRLAAKVTVNKNNSQELGAVSLVRGDGQGSMSLNLKKLKWEIMGTEKVSYLIKSFGDTEYTALSNMFKNWTNWNVPGNEISHWAHSATWSSSLEGYPTGYSQAIDNDLAYPMISGIENAFGVSKYYHETTRPQDVYQINNALASVIIIGQYDVGNLVSTTFYIDDEQKLYLDADLKKKFLEKQTFLYFNGKPVTTDDSNDFQLVHLDDVSNVPANYVTLQFTETAQLKNRFFDAKGVSYEELDKDKLNKALATECGYYEKFDKGKCYFIFPIKNVTSETLSETETGKFGLVRNHQYNITINSINGLGTGLVDSQSFIPLRYTYSGQSSSAYKVNANVSVNEWQNVNQTVDIPKN